MLTGETVTSSLVRLEPLVAGELVSLDLWLYDYQFDAVRSVRTGAEERLDASASERDLGGGGDGRFGSVLAAELDVHGELLGFVTALPAREDSGPASLRVLESLAPLLAAVVVTSSRVLDDLSMTRRSRSMALAAEVQSSLLAPSRFETSRCVVSAAVEPAYETGGDVYDFAERDGHLMASVLDAMGHGLEAALVSTMALAGLRRARRSGSGLVDIAAEVDLAIRSLQLARSVQPGHFVAASLVDLDLASGLGSYLSAGHAAPLVVADGELRELPLSPALPLGLTIGGETSRPKLQSFTLERGQTLILYTDGIVDNKLRGTDDRIGFDHFSRLLRSLLSAGGGAGNARRHLARNLIDGLLSLAEPDLRDDATLLTLHYL